MKAAGVVFGWLACALTCVCVRSAWAGPLNPPSGAITSTNKTLNEIEPRIIINSTNTPGDNDATPSHFKIAQAGSYVLPAGFIAPPNRIAIEIAANDVVIDLGGFHIVNFSTLPAISVTLSGASHITVRNGSVSLGAGIDLSGSTLPASAWGGLVESIRVHDVIGTGLLTQRGAIVRNCSADNCTIGVDVNDRSSAEGCSATDCSSYGIRLGSGTTASNCTSADNSGDGFLLGFGVSISDCSAYSNDGAGFSGGSGCTFRGCSAMFNGGDGFAVSIGCVVTECSAQSNTGDGIQCDYGSHILNNVCRQNGNGTGNAAGIHVLHDRNRIEGNNCSNNDRGIDVDFAGNVIVRNSCGDNTTNWTIVADNIYGPIIDRTAAVTAAVTGNAAGSTLGSTDANANYSY